MKIFNSTRSATKFHFESKCFDKVSIGNEPDKTFRQMEEQVSNAEDSKLDDEEDEVSQDTTGIYIDGEEFFEAEDTLVESDDESLEGNRLEDNRLVGR